MKTTGSLITCGVFILFASSSIAQEPSKGAGIRAFHDIAAVLTSPRCLNCHVPGDSPLQGEENRVHNMKVLRGAQGEGGSPTMHCANCHQDENVATPHSPPGAPGWRMPGASTRMAWQGLTTAQLCGSLKDSSLNGKRSLTDLIEHVSSDAIVKWGWNPGPGRTPPPLSHQQFVAAFKLWAAEGAPCPQ